MRRLILASSIAVAIAAACAHSEAPAAPTQPRVVEMRSTGTPGKVAATRSVQLTGLVKAVDQASRKLTVEFSSGDTETFNVGPQVQRLGEVEVGDTVLLYFEQGLTLEYQAPGSPTVEPTAAAAAGRGAREAAPQGVAAAGVQSTVIVTAIDMGTRMVALQGPRGNVYQVKAAPDLQLEKLKVGDRLLATYVEALAVKLDKTSRK